MLGDIAIGTLGLATLFLFQTGRRKGANILGLLAQPFWFYTAYSASLWGVFFICCVYTAMYIKGVFLDD